MDLIWLILSILVWGMLHSLFASLPVKKRSRRLFGPGVERVYRLDYNLFAVLSLVPVLAQVGLHPGRTIYIVQLPWSVIMLAGEVLALLALVIGFSQSQPSDFLGLRQLVSPGG